MLRSFPLRWTIGRIKMHVDMQIDALRTSRTKSAVSSKSKRPSSSRDFVRYDISSAQGRVWVPPMTQKEIQERAQYWDKFTVARSDLLFKEVVDSSQLHLPQWTSVNSDIASHDDHLAKQRTAFCPSRSSQSRAYDETQSNNQARQRDHNLHGWVKSSSGDGRWHHSGEWRANSRFL